MLCDLGKDELDCEGHRIHIQMYIQQMLHDHQLQLLLPGYLQVF